MEFCRYEYLHKQGNIFHIHKIIMFPLQITLLFIGSDCGCDAKNYANGSCEFVTNVIIGSFM